MISDYQHMAVPMYVGDQEEALRSYTENLGFEKRADNSTPDGGRWLTAASSNTKTQFVPLRPEDKPVPLEDRGRLGMEIGFAGHFVLECDDIQATHGQLAGSGVELTQAPEQMPWGMQMAQFKDLYGNVIGLVQEDEVARAQGQ